MGSPDLKLSMDTAAEQAQRASIVSLPSELIHQILSYLPAISLYAVSLTCSHLKEHCDVDQLWEEQVSRLKLVTPSPYPSYKILHNALAPRLFLPRKIFIGDRHPYGFVVASLYNSNTGSIEIYPLIEDRRSSPDHIFLLAPWSRDPRVFIYDCNPRIRLWEEAEVKIGPFSHQNLSGEIPQSTRSKRDVFATYFPARATLEADVRKLTAERSDDGHTSFWPPAIIPSDERVRIRRTPIHHASNYFTAEPEAGVVLPNIFRRILNAVSEPQPGTNDEESDTTPDQQTPTKNTWALPDTSTSGYMSHKAFNVRKWTKFENHRPTIETYFELDETLWTPTQEFPLRGIFIGDYSAHGNEFLLFHQTAGTSSQPPRLEAIKLTGDPNVPRGKHTFIVDDLTPSSAIRIAPDSETEWPGACIYGGRGQIAMDQFGPSQFIDVEVVVPAKTSFSIVSTVTGFQMPMATAAQAAALALSSSQSSTESETSFEDSEETAQISAPWIKQEVAVYWKGIGGGIRRYKRVDVERFFK